MVATLAWLALCLLAGLAAPASSQDAIGPKIDAAFVAERKANVEEKLAALGPAPADGAEAADVAEVRTTLAQIVATLGSIELSIENRRRFEELTEGIPSQLRKLAVDRQALERQPTARREDASEAALEDYLRQRDNAQSAIDQIVSDANAGDVRAAAIARRQEEFAGLRVQLQRSLKEAREGGDSEDRGLGLLRVELAELRLAELNFSDEALQAEREWLIERTPLVDDSLMLAKQRLEAVTADLRVIESALGADLEQRREDLRIAEADLTRQLSSATDPVQAAQLGLRLETLEVRRATARFGEDYVRLNELIDLQGQRSTRVERILERLASLVEKYSEGEAIAQRLLSLLDRLAEERGAGADEAARSFESRLPELNAELFRIDDELYEFDESLAAKISELEGELAVRSEAETAAVKKDLRALAKAKKTALRENQEVVGKIVDGVNTLQAMAKAHRKLIDDSYREALAKMFWIRNAEPFNASVLARALSSLGSATARFWDVVVWEFEQVKSALARTGSVWLLVAVVFFGVPWVAIRSYRWFGRLAEMSLAEQTQRGEAPGLNPALGILAQAAVWPLYIMLLVWLCAEGLPDVHPPLMVALLDGGRSCALILGIYLFGRRLFRDDGWGQQFWELEPELCAFLRRALFFGSLACFLLLVPRQILLDAPGSTAQTAGSVALARVLFVIFQLIAIALVASLGRRSSPLMHHILDASHQREGFLWRTWPLLYAGLLAGLVFVLALDLLGLRFAATRLWTQTFSSIAVIPALRFFVAVYVILLLQKLVGLLNTRAEQVDGADSSTEVSTGRAFAFMRISVNALCMALAFAVILEIWGLRVSESLTSPLAFQVVARGLSALGVAGLAFILVQLSKAIASGVLRPRIEGGVTFEAGRKLRTLAPLIQTTFNVIVVFLAAAAILRVVGFDTGPVLAGVGILGLAVGFAAQSLIKDLINGLFILFEDSLSIGDIVTLGGRGGQVERVTLRAVTIRDLQGNVHVIPNGTIDVVTNMTKDFSRYVLDVGVAYREDTDEVVGLLREIDEQMRSEPEYRYDMLEPIEIMGVDRFADSAVIVRARLKTRPIQQWRIGREFNRRIKKVFDEHGIEIPFPHQTLYWGEPKQGGQPPIAVSVESRGGESEGDE